jgi:oligoribonuclease NrnB/cAMP/cGMP phosphodiesterase (DHH superfamily)
MAMQIIAHEDADGICSAALVRMSDPASKVFFSKPCSLLHDLDQMDTRRDIVLLDLALCELAKEQVVNRLSSSGQTENVITRMQNPRINKIEPVFFIIFPPLKKTLGG